MNRNSHIFNSIQFEISISDENEADSFYQRTSQLMNSKLSSRFNKIANQFDKKGFTSIFDSVELNIGQVSEDNFENDLEEAVSEALSQFFKYNLNDFNSNLQLISDFDYYTSHLDHFLKYGYFSWKGGKEISLNKILEFITSNYPEQTKTYFQKISKSKSANQRLINNANSENLDKIFNLFFPSNKVKFQSLIDTIRKNLAFDSYSQNQLRKEVWTSFVHLYFSSKDDKFKAEEFIDHLNAYLALSPTQKMNQDDQFTFKVDKKHETTELKNIQKSSLFFMWLEQYLSQSEIPIEEISTLQTRRLLDRFFKEKKLDKESYREIAEMLDNLALGELFALLDKAKDQAQGESLPIKSSFQEIDSEYSKKVNSTENFATSENLELQEKTALKSNSEVNIEGEAIERESLDDLKRIGYTENLGHEYVNKETFTKKESESIFQDVNNSIDWDLENIHWLDLVENNISKTSQFLSHAVQSEKVPKKLFSQILEFAARLIGNRQLYPQRIILEFIRIEDVKNELFRHERAIEFINEIKNFRSWKWLIQLQQVFNILHHRFIRRLNHPSKVDIRSEVFLIVFQSSKKEIQVQTHRKIYDLFAQQQSHSTTFESYWREFYLSEIYEELTQKSQSIDIRSLVHLFKERLPSFYHGIELGTDNLNLSKIDHHRNNNGQSESLFPMDKINGKSDDIFNQEVYQSLQNSLFKGHESEDQSELSIEEFRIILSSHNARIFLGIQKVRKEISRKFSFDSIILCIAENLTTDAKGWLIENSDLVHEIKGLLDWQEKMQLFEVYKDQLLFGLTVKPLRLMNKEFWSEILTTALSSSIPSSRLKSLIPKLVLNKTKNEIIENAIHTAEETPKSQIQNMKENPTDKTLVEQNDTWFINNAGLVLFSAYIPTLFEKLNIRVNNEFSSPNGQDIGIGILQHLCSGTSEFEESDVLLNKVLCGVETSQIIEIKTDFSKGELELLTSLVTALKSQWVQIKNSSYESLISSFFMREGRLKELPEEFEMIVETRAYDVLLATIPWNYNLIKYSWMKKPLKVVWK